MIEFLVLTTCGTFVCGGFVVENKDSVSYYSLDSTDPVEVRVTK